MSLVPVPVCYSCSTVTAKRISCRECRRICCWACLSLNNGDFVDDRDSLPLTRTSVRVCRKCRAGLFKDGKKQLMFSATELLLSIQKEQKSKEVEVIPTKESTPMLCTPEGREGPTMKPSSSDDKPMKEPPVVKDEPLSTQQEQIEEVKPSVPVPKESAAPMKLKPELCFMHDKERTLYCLTCEESICENCFLIAASHMRHQIDFVQTVYLERLTSTEHKLVQLDETVKALDGDAAQSRYNLEIIQQVERSIYKDIDALCAEDKLTVTRMTGGRKRTLRVRSEFPAKKQKLNDALQDMVRHFPPAEFLKHQSRLDKQCDELLAESVTRSFVPERSEDIGCDLIPPYEVRTFQLANFESTAIWRYFMHACDTAWTVYLRNKNSLFVKAVTQTKEALGLPFKLLVVIIHQDCRKTIRKTFTVRGTSEELEIVSVDQLKAQGFIKASNLYVKIGLRPLNVLTVNQLLKQQFNIVKKKLDVFGNRFSPLQQDVNCQFYNMHFSVNLFKQKNGTSAQHSTNLTDSANRQWCLRVYPFDRSSTAADTDLKVFIVLRKGTYTKCCYFVELLNSDPAKSVQQVATNVFASIDAGHGWHNFVERKQLLCDSGFFPNGVLRFRFGVQPITD